MTDYAEEQRNEIEALESIYPSEFEVVEVEPFYSFTIFIKTDKYEEDEESEEAEGAACKLHFSYVADYPDAAPHIDVEDYVNIDEDVCDSLKRVLKEEAENNVGMVMIFTLVSAAQEWLNVKLEESVKQKQEASERLQREQEAAEIKRFDGTVVTVESFLKWKAQFDAEMSSMKKTISKDEINKKLTGRELFERDQTLNESDMKFLMDEEILEIDESLFQEFAEEDSPCS